MGMLRFDYRSHPLVDKLFFMELIYKCFVNIMFAQGSQIASYSEASSNAHWAISFPWALKLKDTWPQCYLMQMIKYHDLKARADTIEHCWWSMGGDWVHWRIQLRALGGAQRFWVGRNLKQIINFFPCTAIDVMLKIKLLIGAK